jgi:Xaa-Pro aminopeptidase
MSPHLEPMAIAARAAPVRTRMAGAGADALLVTRLPNVRYLTGFTGSAGILVVAAEELVFVTDGRYDTQAREQLGAVGVDARIESAPASAQSELLTRVVAPFRCLGLEAHGVTWAQQRGWARAFTGNELVATEDLVEGVRRVKEDGEVARIRAACAIADDALADTLPMLREGPSERAFALALEIAMRERGASGTSFDTICAAGPHAALPHARPTDRAVERGELVVIDFGCVVDGYCSDMTRTVSVGDPGADARRLWEVVYESQRAGRDAVAAGVACADGTGHGVGLEIHEAPRVAKAAGGTLETGVVVTVEPGVYLPGVGGVRLEDTVVVTDGGADALTSFPKHLSLEAA